MSFDLPSALLFLFVLSEVFLLSFWFLLRLRFLRFLFLLRGLLFLLSPSGLSPVSGFVDSNVSVGLGGSVTLTDLNAALPLELFADISGIRGLQGNGSFQFERLEIVDGLAVVASGVMQVGDLIVPIVGRDSLGGYQAEFFTQNNGISASIEDTDGVLDLAGSLQIKTDRSFEFIAQVVVKPETPESVRRQLRFLPPANDRGQQELRLAGIL